jgi:hypothetical protein
MSPLKIETPVENIGKQRCAEGFNSAVRGLSTTEFEKKEDFKL